MNARESGAWVDGDVVENLGERLLVCAQYLDVSHRDLKLINEVFPLLPDKRYGVRREQDVLVVCGEERDVCLDGFVGVGQDLQAVLGVLVCAGEGSVVPRHPEARGLGTRGEPEVCAHSTVRRLCPQSGVGGGRWGDLDARPRGKC